MIVNLSWIRYMLRSPDQYGEEAIRMMDTFLYSLSWRLLLAGSRVKIKNTGKLYRCLEYIPSIKPSCCERLIIQIHQALSHHVVEPAYDLHIDS